MCYYMCFGVTAQLRAEHMVCMLMKALRAGMKTMMHCRLIDQAMMMHCSLVGIPPAVSSLADEVDERGACFHTSTT